MPPTAETAVQKSITVAASPERAFEVFTHDFDSWWPRTHHIGKSPMKRAVIEERAGGRCYSAQEDGTDCPWGTVLVWDPPHRLVLAWQINELWQYVTDVESSSEVEIRFTAVPGGTRVDLEHRHLERHGTAAAEVIRKAVSAEGGWSSLLQMYAARVAAG